MVAGQRSVRDEPTHLSCFGAGQQGFHDLPTHLTAACFVACFAAVQQSLDDMPDMLQFHYLPTTHSTFVDAAQQGQTSKEYLEIKKMAFLEPALLHAMLKSLADSIGDYANYQARHPAFFSFFSPMCI